MVIWLWLRSKAVRLPTSPWGWGGPISLYHFSLSTSLAAGRTMAPNVQANNQPSSQGTQSGPKPSRPRTSFNLGGGGEPRAAARVHCPRRLKSPQYAKGGGGGRGGLRQERWRGKGVLKRDGRVTQIAQILLFPSPAAILNLCSLQIRLYPIVTSRAVSVAGSTVRKVRRCLLCPKERMPRAHAQPKHTLTYTIRHGHPTPTRTHAYLRSRCTTVQPSNQCLHLNLRREGLPRGCARTCG